MATKTNQLNNKEIDSLIKSLKVRFEQNKHRHPGIIWEDVFKRLLKHPEKLWSLQKMEESGGEPDVIEINKKADAYQFFDCSSETPKGRRSLCYDEKALEERKEHKPKGSAHEMAAAMDIQLLNEEQYRLLQSLEPVDLKTSSWIQTPDSVRELGGALFCDRRYDQVFVYHNGAISYYAARGFRGVLSV